MLFRNAVNTGLKAGMHPGRDAYLSGDTMHTHSSSLELPLHLPTFLVGGRKLKNLQNSTTKPEEHVNLRTDSNLSSGFDIIVLLSI